MTTLTANHQDRLRPGRFVRTFHNAKATAASLHAVAARS